VCYIESMNKESGYIPPVGASQQGRLNNAQEAGRLGDHSVEGAKAPGAKQGELREASLDSTESLQSHSVEVAKSSSGFWSKVVGVFDQARAVITAKTGVITSHRVHLDGIILNASRDPGRAVDVFAKWGESFRLQSR